jgi:quercetin dioxygenase-like cupin family protein
MSRKQAVATVRIDDARILATEWSFEEGAETGWHRHAMDYMVIPLSNGRLMVETAGGNRSEADLTLGVPYTRAAGVEHNVVNATPGRFAFLEIEFKGTGETSSG